MDTLRASVRLVLFFVSACMVVLCLAPLRLAGAPQRVYLKWKRKVVKVFAKAVVRITGMRIEVSGQPPEPPFFMVTNHLSYMDVIPLWLYTAGTFVAKSEIKSWPFFGFAAKSTGILFIDREKRNDIVRVNSILKNAMNDYQGIILFPEGTTTEGDKVLPFHAPLLQFPASNNMPVFFASLTYTTGQPDKPASEYICWWGDMTFFRHFFLLLTLKSFTVHLVFGEQSVEHPDRKMLARILHQKVEGNFNPVDSLP